ncbi:drug/metabolite transporter (DMT)-like permease [Streptomyces sp. HB132]|nr:drug/metabolite transporter (DMT)-like permease [Streptomyces sp. HB132]
MIQPGRGRQILLFGLLAALCGALLLVLSSGTSPALELGVLLVAGGVICAPVSLISRNKGKGKE